MALCVAGEDPPSPVDWQAHAGNEVVIDEVYYSQGDALRAPFVLHQRRVDGFSAFGFRQIGSKHHLTGQDAVDPHVWVAGARIAATAEVQYCKAK